MSFIGNFAAARAYKATAAYNRELYMMQSRLQKAKTAQAKAVYDNIDRVRLVKKQDSDYDFLFVRALKSGAEFREGDTPFFVGIKNKSNQMLDLALSDYNTKVTVNDMVNQSLLLQARGRGELFKGKLTARAEYMKAAGSLLTMGYESDKQGRLVIL